MTCEECKYAEWDYEEYYPHGKQWCKYAEWDYEEYYPHGKQWFICGCKLGKDEAGCDEEEEE